VDAAIAICEWVDVDKSKGRHSAAHDGRLAFCAIQKNGEAF
jgi:hypothetical protein